MLYSLLKNTQTGGCGWTERVRAISLAHSPTGVRPILNMYTQHTHTHSTLYCCCPYARPFDVYTSTERVAFLCILKTCSMLRLMRLRALTHALARLFVVLAARTQTTLTHTHTHEHIGA